MTSVMRYAEMKESGVEWTNGIPCHWEVFPAKALFKKCDECKRKDDIQLTASQKYGIISQKDYMDREQSKIVLANKDIEKWKHLEKNDFVISLRSFQGGIEFSKISGCITWHYIVLRANIKIYHLFYKWLFKSFVYIQALQSTCNFIRDGQDLRYSNFTQIYLFYPPLPEQRAIADYLDRQCAAIDDILSSARASIEDYKQLKASTIYEAVTKGLNPDVEMKDSGVEWIGEIPAEWRIEALKRNTSKIGSGKTPSGGAEVYTSDGIIFLRSQNVYNTGLKLEDVSHISEEIDKEMSNTRVQYNDILLNITGGSIGRCCIYNLVNTPANVNQHVCIIRANEKHLKPALIRYFWNSSCGERVINFYQTGGNRQGLNFEQIGNVKLPVCPRQEQDEIIDYLDTRCAQIDALIAEKQSLITDLEAYKKSLIYECVTGKRRVPDVAE